MFIKVAVLGNNFIRHTVEKIAHDKGFISLFFKILEEMTSEIADVQVIIVSLCDEEIFTVFKNIQFLRTRLRYRGPLIILSFFTKEWIVKQEWGEFVNTPGCFYLQMPFLVHNLVNLLTNTINLSDEAMLYTSKRLGARHITRKVGFIKHYCDNEFALALAHMRELEKLSYFKDPNLKQVLREFAFLKNVLTEDKFKEMQYSLEELAKDVSEWDITDIDLVVLTSNECKENISSWFQFCQRTLNSIELDKYELFERAKLVRDSLGKIFLSLKNLKRKAEETIDSV